MQYYKIELTIGKDGTVTEKVLASGSECTKVTADIEKAIGDVRCRRRLASPTQELLPEYQQSNEIQSESETLWH